MNEYFLIDAPVSASSGPEEIRVWIRKLETMPNCPEVRAALADALEMLESCIELRGSDQS